MAETILPVVTEQPMPEQPPAAVPLMMLMPTPDNSRPTTPTSSTAGSAPGSPRQQHRVRFESENSDTPFIDKPPQRVLT